MQRRTGLLHLRNGGTSVVLDSRHAPLPVIVYWGADLGDLGETELAALGTASLPQRVSGGLDQPAPLTLIPQESTGWLGTPGLAGHRDGRHFSTKLVAESIDVDEASTTATVTATDAAAGLAATITLEVTAAGLLRQRLSLENRAPEPYSLGSLAATFPVPRRPRRAARHHRAPPARALAAAPRLHDRRPRAREPARPAGLRREPRCSPPAAGASGSSAASPTRCTWPGAATTGSPPSARPPPSRSSPASELLGSGEIVLAEGESYTTPWAIGSWGDGLNELSRALPRRVAGAPAASATPSAGDAQHVGGRVLRPRPRQARRPRGARGLGRRRAIRARRRLVPRAGATTPPVSATGSSTRASGRRASDPLIEHVRGLGMEFGLWVEPEMINPDSELARRHPDWILRGRDDAAAVRRGSSRCSTSRTRTPAHYLLERLTRCSTSTPSPT